MFRSASVDNFRGLRHLEVPRFEQFNLIAGLNNVGKTSLLDALFLLLGHPNPQLTTTIQHFRGMPLGSPPSLWPSLFHDYDTNQPIIVSATDENTLIHCVRLALSLAKESRLPAGPEASGNGSFSSSAGAPGAPTPLDRLEVAYVAPDGREYVSEIDVAVGELRLKQSGIAGFPGYYLAAGARQSSALPFNELVQQKRQDLVLKPMQLFEPRLRQLQIMLVGGEAVVAGDIGLDHVVPLPLMGAGMGRLLYILCTILQRPGSVVLIDEIENGIHHTMLSDVWRAIADAARETNAQIIATTHSWECISAAQQVFCLNKPVESADFLLHHFERRNDRIVDLIFDAEALSAAVEHGTEVR